MVPVYHISMLGGALLFIGILLIKIIGMGGKKKLLPEDDFLE